ncbi:MAG: metal-dependent hydrolase [Vulcanimicrobiota bacterium]
MDSVTQFVLGAAIGEMTLRRADAPKEGRALTWQAAGLGGLVGTLPDLDVFTHPFLSAPEALASHRGLTHSAFFCTLLSPLLAALFQRLFKRDISLRRWTLFVWLGLNTHWMLDCLTTYGTQIFQPFSNYPVNIGSLFIIDPLVTIPLGLALLTSLWKNRGGRPLNLTPMKTGLVFFIGYLAFTLVSKYTVQHRLKTDWESQGIEYRQMITAAAPFTSLVFYAYVDTGTDVWVTNGALLDPPDRKPVWQKVPKNADLLPQFGEGPAGRTLLWFSRGFYSLDLDDGNPVFNDLRFGRLRGWLTTQEPAGRDFVFRYYLEPAKLQGPYESWGRRRSEGRLAEYPWDLLRRRMMGKD